MSKKQDAELEASMRRHRPAEQVAADIGTTIFGQLADEARETRLLAVAAIKPSPYQARGTMDPAHVTELATSIASGGLLTPILVRKSGEPGEYELVAGHHRLAAFRELGREQIPAIVRTLTDQEAARALTVENTQHRALTDWEKFGHIKMLTEMRAYRFKNELANLLGVGPEKISGLEAFGLLPPNAAGLLDASPDLLSARTAYDLRHHSASHPAIVAEGLELLAKGHIKQTSLLKWVEHRISPPVRARPDEREYLTPAGKIRCTAGAAGFTITGNINRERFLALLEAHKDELIEAPPKA